MPSSGLCSAWSVRAAAGQPVATIRVRNLQAFVGTGASAGSGPDSGGAAPVSPQDAWGRPGRPQPLLISAEVSMAAPFSEASADDRVAADTVHYGTLSKALLQSVGKAQGGTLRALLDRVWQDLTGSAVTEAWGEDLTGSAVTEARGEDLTGGAVAEARGASSSTSAALDMARVRCLTLTLLLPKASLVGQGVSLTASKVFFGDAEEFSGAAEKFSGAAKAKAAVTAVTLGLHRLRLPVLVGVNANERLAKQTLIVDVEIDRYDGRADAYVALEALVVRALEASAFETLEALGVHVGRAVMAADMADKHWQVAVAMEKPMAVALADAPIVEVRLGPA